MLTPCKLELDVLPLDSVDMYGEPDKNSAYSLSGHVEVKLTPPASVLYDPPATEERFMLESLVLTFEGQSELLTPQTGYGACRLVKFSQELIQGGPIEIGHFWDQNLRDPQRWLITFNLAIPGWLPPSCSTSYGNGVREEQEVSYRLTAKATYRDMRPGSSKPLRFMCSSYSSLPSTQIATSPPASVKINRFTLPPPHHHLDTSEFPNFPFHSIEYAGSIKGSSSQIPADVLSKLRVLAYLPEHIPLECESFPLFIRLRPEGLTADERKRLRLPKFSITATQMEVLRTSMSSKYAAKWPVPPELEQPPKKPLRSRRGDVREYECGLLLSAPSHSTCKPTYSILPREFPDHFDLQGSDKPGGAFDDAAFDDPNTWIQMRLDVPFRDVFVDEKYLEHFEELPVPKLRPTECGPMLTVLHNLDIALHCTYDTSESGDAGAEPAADELRLTLPLNFVRVPNGDAHLPIVELMSSSRSISPTSIAESATFPPPSLPYAQALPAYNQLYYSNGTLREDPTPLPRYTRDAKDAEDPPPPPVACKQTPPTKLPLSPLLTASGAASST
ncbi:hypothetical protein BV20DRAFT_1032769 [Pilatotrama ljubarskyi]|nr:hypothetical protein BV20DRAFT_1032769 [Pilatotrama ljubarskyi]